MQGSKPTLVVIMGPTAVGKTGLAIACAERWSTEIISADSRQVFRELTIGTAKPSGEALERIRHHFINCRSIHDPFTAEDFGREGRALLSQLFGRYPLVVVCGGSGLYIKALLQGFDPIPGVPGHIRTELQKEYEAHGIGWLRESLKKIDPGQFDRIDSHNPRRLIRALEVKIGTGKSISEFQTGESQELPYRVLKLGLELDRSFLYDRIDRRVDEMVAQGLEKEARALYPQRLNNALQTVGYQEWFDFFDGKKSREETIALIKQNTRNYAKRQLTWFRKDPEINWFTPDQTEMIFEWVEGSPLR